MPFFTSLTAPHKHKLISVLKNLKRGIASYIRQNKKQIGHFIKDPYKSLQKIFKHYTKTSPLKTADEQYTEERKNWSEHLRLITIEHQCEILINILQKTPDFDTISPEMSSIIADEILNRLDTIFTMFQNTYKKRPAGRQPIGKVWDEGLGCWVVPSHQTQPDVPDTLSDISDIADIADVADDIPEIPEIPESPQTPIIHNEAEDTNNEPLLENALKRARLPDNDWNTWTENILQEIYLENVFS